MADCITTTAVIKGQISATVTVNAPTNDVPCPLIICVDGGAASTASFPAVNGLLNGGGS